MNASEVLRRITTALDQADIAYMLTGSFASAHHGALRSTQDIDLVVEATAAQLRTFTANLPDGEYYVDSDAALKALKRESMFNVIDLESGWKIDLIIRKSRAFSHEEFGRRQKITLQGVSLWVASAEDVVIAKLEWAKLAQSQRQIEDVASLLKLRWKSLDHRYLEKWTRALDIEKQWHEARTAARL